MLIDNRFKTVELFIENIHWGKISVNPAPNDINPEYFNNIHKKINDWIKLSNKKKLDFEDEMYFDEITDELYDIYMYNRIDGTIQGELRDEEREKEIMKLKLEIEKLKSELDTLRNDNIKLANELHDYRYTIESYENAVTNNRGKDQQE